PFGRLGRVLAVQTAGTSARRTDGWDECSPYRRLGRVSCLTTPGALLSERFFQRDLVQRTARCGRAGGAPAERLAFVVDQESEHVGERVVFHAGGGYHLPHMLVGQGFRRLVERRQRFPAVVATRFFVADHLARFE